jgi:RNA polymerase sigma-70 factor (ECF subfamily)
MTESARHEDHLGRLMHAAQQGDAKAYIQLLEEITPRIRQLVRRQRAFMSADDVEDLVQDVLLSLHAVRATYDPGRPFMPWLLAILRNRLADGARRYARAGAHEVCVENLAVTFADERANTTMKALGDVPALEHAIGTLPPMQRNAIRMLKLKEMSLKEAADALNTTVGALKAATYRAMASLRKMLVNKE